MSDERPRSRSVLLPAILELKQVNELYEHLSAALEEPLPQQMLVDMGEVSSVDTAGVQTLVAFVTAVELGGAELVWENLSVQLYQAAAELGLEQALHC